MFSFNVKGFSGGSSSSSSSHSYSSSSSHSYSAPKPAAPVAKVAPAPAKSSSVASAKNMPVKAASAKVAPVQESQPQKVIVVNHYNTVYENHSPTFSDYLMWHYWFGRNNQQQQNYQGSYGQLQQAQTYVGTVQPNSQSSDYAVLWGITGFVGVAVLVVWFMKKFEF